MIQFVSYPVPSSDGIHTLAGRVFLPAGYPETPAVGIFHIVHGMIEHISRYDAFMQEVANTGWIVCGYDNLGHGDTVTDPSERGYIAKKNGWDYLLRDVKVFSDDVRAKYGKDLPYVLMGHSMGSFIVRLATERYVRPDGLIIMGTGGPNPAAGVGILLTRIIAAFKGDRHVSPLVESLSIGRFNERFGGTKNAPNPVAWMTDDDAVCQTFLSDEQCRFKFSVSAMGDLMRLLKDCNRSAWYQLMPKDLPILLVAGDADPVGDYGKGVQTVYHRLQKAGADVSCRMYPGMRHEILNSIGRDAVVEDLLAFLPSTAVRKVD